MKLPSLVMTDIDGVWTDGGMYYSEHGDELKRFNTYDSAGVLFCHRLNIPVCIITGENTKAVERRAKKLKVDRLHQGVSNKLQVGKMLCQQYNITLDECAYIGDDINDWQLLRAAGFSGAPISAPDYIKAHVDFVSSRHGGEGVFRDFIEEILRRCGYSDEWFLGETNDFSGKQ